MKYGVGAAYTYVYTTEDSTARNWLTKERVCILFSENKIDEEDEKWTISDKNSFGDMNI